MQFDPSVKPAAGSQPDALKPDASADVLKDQINKKGLDALDKSDEPSKGADLESKKIESKKGWGGAIASFYSRHFSKISPEDQTKADEIKVLLTLIEDNLKFVPYASKLAKSKEKKFTGPYPSEESLKIGTEFLEEARKSLQGAKDNLVSLKTKEANANELAKKHASFDSLPTTIIRLEREIDLLEGRIAIGEKLLDLEEAMKDYFPDETWSQFTEITAVRRNFYQSIKKIISENPALKDDPALKIYTDKTQLAPSDIKAIVSSLYPDLKGNVTRMFDTTQMIFHKRLFNLKTQVEELLPLFSKHKEISTRIENLESALHSRSILSKISRAFHGKKNLNDQLKIAKEEGKQILMNLQDKGKFNPEELLWLQEKAPRHPNMKALASDINDVQTSLSFLELRDPVSNEIAELIVRHGEYGGAKLQEERAETPEYKKVAKTAVQGVRDHIISDFEKFAPQLDKIKEMKKGKLPPDFDALDNFSQFKVLIPLAFASLKVKTGILADLIEEMELTEDFNKAIEKGKSVPVSVVEEEEPSVLEEDSLEEEADVGSDESSEEELQANVEEAKTGKEPVKAPPSLAAAPPQEAKRVAANLTEEGEPAVAKQALPTIKKSDLPPSEEQQPSVLDQIKGGSNLKKGEPLRKGKPDLLGQIRTGLKLNRPKPFEKPKPKEGEIVARDFATLLALLKAGEIKESEITPAEFNKLSLADQMKLKMAAREKSLGAREEGGSDAEDSDWEV